MAPSSPVVNDSNWPPSPGYSVTTPNSEPASPGYEVTSPGYEVASPALSVIASPTRSSANPQHLNWRDCIYKIPRLPSPRPRALTPTGFRENDRQEEQRHVSALLQTSSWFKVPAHLRRDILRLAFGDRRLHMCLKLDAGPPPTWHSSGMVCHRVSPEDEGPMTRGSQKKGPWVDDCDSLGQDTEPIGIMGWLLSCRQNYAETIDILYSMNTILIYDEPLLTSLTQLILPHRLAVITSLEIKWPLKTVDHLHPLFQLLSLPNFPNLKRLYISLEFEWDFQEDFAPASITSVLNKFVRNRSDLIECAIAVPFRTFDNIAHDLIHTESSWKRQTYSEIWCSLDGSLHAIRMPYVDSYPHPPFHLGPNPGAGYWLLEGTDAPLTWRWRSNSNANGWSGIFEGWEDWDESVVV